MSTEILPKQVFTWVSPGGRSRKTLATENSANNGRGNLQNGVWSATREWESVYNVRHQKLQASRGCKSDSVDTVLMELMSRNVLFGDNSLKIESLSNLLLHWR